MIGPGDLIALVTFEGTVYPNLAVTRERLGRPQQAPHALGAALAHWLRRRHLWLEVRGRQIHGIATARPLAGPSAWQIDTLIDAGDGAHAVLRPLLEQAQAEALRAGAGKLLLRMPAGVDDALAEVRAAGFKPALAERLWHAPARTAAAGSAAQERVREAGEADWFGRFQLYNQALPVEARRAIALTYEEWRATLEEQWLSRRHHDFVAIDEQRVGGALRLGHSQGGAQLELLATSREAAAALLREAQSQREPDEPLLALAPQGVTAVESALADAGFEPREEYLLLSRRLQRPVEETVTAGAGIAVPSGG